MLCLLLGAGLVLGCTGQETLPTGDPAAGESEGEGAAAGEGSTLSELTLAVSPGPVSFPVAYLLEQEEENTEKAKINTVDWRTNEQLVSMITNKQVHIATTPLQCYRAHNKADIGCSPLPAGEHCVVGRRSANGWGFKGQEMGNGQAASMIWCSGTLAEGSTPIGSEHNIPGSPGILRQTATGDLKYAILNNRRPVWLLWRQENSITLARVLDPGTLGEATGTKAASPAFCHGERAVWTDAADFAMLQRAPWVNANPNSRGGVKTY